MGATGGSIPRHQENCTPHLCNKSVGRTRMARGTARASGIGKGAGAVAGHKGCFARCARTGKNLPQTRGGRMQQLCNKFARDGRSEGAAEGGGAPRMAAGRHQDRRTKGRAPIAEGTRCRAKRETTDPATCAWRGPREIGLVCGSGFRVAEWLRGFANCDDHRPSAVRSAGVIAPSSTCLSR